MSRNLSAPTQNAKHALACTLPELFRKQGEEDSQSVDFYMYSDTPCSMGIYRDFLTKLYTHADQNCTLNNI